MRPTSQGGFEFPDFCRNFLATQLVTSSLCLSPDITNSSVLLEALKFLIFHGPHAPYPLTPSMLTTLHAWGAGLKCELYPKQAVSPNAPLWSNPNLHQIYKLPEPYAWTKFNIKTVSQIVDNQSLAPLPLLSSKCNVPESYLFHYFQLSIAFSSQFSHFAPQIIQS